MMKYNDLLRFIVAFIVIGLPLTQLDGQQQSFGLNEKLGEYIPDNISLLNEDSVEVNLIDLVDKPTLLSFVYYHCPSLCPKMLEGISELANFSKLIPGKDYQVIVLSIDPTESTQLANSTKAKYTGLITHPVNKYFWRFFTADSLSIKTLTDVAGWEFRKRGDDFVHTTSSLLITPKGMISQYFYGTYFNAMHFDMSVEKALVEEIVPTRLKTLKYCYNYRPEKNLKVDTITKIFGISVIILALGLFIFLMKVPKNGKVQ